jgi:hypothetical protein
LNSSNFSASVTGTTQTQNNGDDNQDTNDTSELSSKISFLTTDNVLNMKIAAGITTTNSPYLISVT